MPRRKRREKIDQLCDGCGLRFTDPNDFTKCACGVVGCYQCMDDHAIECDQNGTLEDA